MQSVNGITYPLDDHSYNAMAMAKVDVCVPGQSQHEKESDLRKPKPLYQNTRKRDHGLRKSVRRRLALAGRETLTDGFKEFWRIFDDESEFENHLDSS